MGREVRVYRISGMMKLYRLGEWRKFTLEIPALRPEHAVERVYSELGSRHKLKRSHIKILKVEEISEEEVTKPYVKELLSLDRIVVY
ncbi:MAG: 50S ribosomal protein L18a [Thermoprotei archaeon]|nr:50S ribosomal protein LX [Thermoproteales archaeon]RLE87074.1 MAG: 50S ribosomal protein L18a [Thermoprotei archaeon]RLE96802.1 MAG: 50S ribosomal protein L18a [Thermoprotei archaeon]